MVCDAPLEKREVIAAAPASTSDSTPLPFEKLLDVREERIKPREVDPVTC